MRRVTTVAFMAMLAVGCLTPFPLAAAQRLTGTELCDLAIAQAGTGQGQFGRYERVYASEQGGSGSQVVVGTEGNDVLDGGSGNDVLCGLGGDDRLSGGSGNDILVGGPGSDELYGESGADTLYSDPSDDIVEGGTGRNMVIEEDSGSQATLSYVLGTSNGEVCTLTVSLSGGPPNQPVALSYRYVNDRGLGDQQTNTSPFDPSTSIPYQTGASGTFEASVIVPDDAQVILLRVLTEPDRDLIAALEVNDICEA